MPWGEYQLKQVSIFPQQEIGHNYKGIIRVLKQSTPDDENKLRNNKK